MASRQDQRSARLLAALQRRAAALARRPKTGSLSFEDATTIAASWQHISHGCPVRTPTPSSKRERDRSAALLVHFFNVCRRRIVVAAKRGSDGWSASEVSPFADSWESLAVAQQANGPVATSSASLTGVTGVAAAKCAWIARGSPSRSLQFWRSFRQQSASDRLTVTEAALWLGCVTFRCGYAPQHLHWYAARVAQPDNGLTRCGGALLSSKLASLVVSPDVLAQASATWALANTPTALTAARITVIRHNITRHCERYAVERDDVAILRLTEAAVLWILSAATASPDVRLMNGETCGNLRGIIGEMTWSQLNDVVVALGSWSTSIRHCQLRTPADAESASDGALMSKQCVDELGRAGWSRLFTLVRHYQCEKHQHVCMSILCGFAALHAAAKVDVHAASNASGIDLRDAKDTIIGIVADTLRLGPPGGAWRAVVAMHRLYPQSDFEWVAELVRSIHSSRVRHCHVVRSFSSNELDAMIRMGSFEEILEVFRTTFAMAAVASTLPVDAPVGPIKTALLAIAHVVHHFVNSVTRSKPGYLVHPGTVSAVALAVSLLVDRWKFLPPLPARVKQVLHAALSQFVLHDIVARSPSRDIDDIVVLLRESKQKQLRDLAVLFATRRNKYALERAICFDRATRSDCFSRQVCTALHPSYFMDAAKTRIELSDLHPSVRHLAVDF